MSAVTVECGRCEATIEERGNGLPTVGDYVPADNGGLYRVVTLDGPIHTGSAPGAANYIHATVEPADWGDCPEDEEFPALAILSEVDEGEEDQVQS